MKQRKPLELIPALMLVVFSGSVNASGFQLLEQNASGIGNAYAGSAAVAENASTIYYNPAGMTQLQAHEVSVGMSAVDPSYKFSDKGSQVGGLMGAGNGGGAGGWSVIPNGYASWALSRDFFIGIGVGSPFGLKTDYDDRWLGAAQAQSSEINTLNINPSVAWRVNDKLSLGAGVNWQRVDAIYKRMRSISDTAQVKLVLDDDSWGWNVGALYTVSPSTKIGLSYRSSIKHETDGHTDINGVKNNASKANLKLPDTAILSVTQQLSDKWQMLGDISWTGWGAIPSLDIMNASSGATQQIVETKFNNTWRVALGANYALNEAIKFKYGIAYDRTPVPNAAYRLVSLPDNDRVWLSLGAEWKPDQTSRFDFGLAYIYVRDSKIDNDQTANNQGRMIGEYSGSIWVLGAQYSMSF